MPLHTIKKEFTHPVLDNVYETAMANFLYYYDGLYGLIVTRERATPNYGVWYFHEDRNPYPFSDDDLRAWSEHNEYGTHKLDWNDIVIVNTPQDVEYSMPMKRYVRHD